MRVQDFVATDASFIEIERIFHSLVQLEVLGHLIGDDFSVHAGRVASRDLTSTSLHPLIRHVYLVFELVLRLRRGVHEESRQFVHVILRGKDVISLEGNLDVLVRGVDADHLVLVPCRAILPVHFVDLGRLHLVCLV